MNVRDPRVYEQLRRRNKQRRRVRALRRRVVAWGLVLFFAATSLLTVQYVRALPRVEPITFAVAHEPQTIPIAWPAQGQAALVLPDDAGLLMHGEQKPVATASVAKLILAYTVLKHKPLQAGEEGPILTATQQDVGSYEDYAARGGAVLPVAAGDQLTQYEALQAVMLPSANNIADMLARWAFGSHEAYRTAAQQAVQDLGMSQTRIGSDASGLAPDTVGTAKDMVLLGRAIVGSPVLRKIMSQQTAYVPLFGRINNRNTLLGGDVFGIKTGNSDEAGGCFVFAAEHTFADGQKRTFVGAIMAAPSLGHAMDGVMPLLDSAYSGYGYITLARQGQAVAQYRLPWGGQVQAVATQDLNMFGWRGSAHNAKLDAVTLSPPMNKNASVGKLYAGQASAPVVLSANAMPPPPRWRLLRR